GPGPLPGPRSLRHRAQAERAPRLRRRPPLLPGGAPGADGGSDRNRRARPAFRRSGARIGRGRVGALALPRPRTPAHHLPHAEGPRVLTSGQYAGVPKRRARAIATGASAVIPTISQKNGRSISVMSIRFSSITRSINNRTIVR